MIGFDNEYEFVKAINNKKINELNTLLQELIINLFGEVDSNVYIKAWRNHYKQKTDVLIKYGNIIKRISVKMGSRNLVHVESLDSFVYFLKSNGISEEIIDIYLRFHFGDGTIDGSGLKRISAAEIQQEYQLELDRLNIYFSDIKIIQKVIDRFVIEGLIYNDHIDALVLGIPTDFLVLYESDIISIIKSKSNKYCKSPHFGPLIVQPLNRCINRNPKYEDKRFYIQIKWYSLFDDIIEYMNNMIIEKNGLSFQDDNVA